jgi:thiamine biosynthesis lipoprotein
MILKKKLLLMTVLLCILSISASGCGKKAYSQGKAQEEGFLSRSDILLNTIVTIQLYDKQNQSILDGCFDLIRHYEVAFSRTNPSAELAILNNKAFSRKIPKKAPMNSLPNWLI